MNIKKGYGYQERLWISRKAMNIKKASVGLPEGYIFVFAPPPVPLTYPGAESYHLINAGPTNEAPKIERKRMVFGGITNGFASAGAKCSQRGYPMGVGLRTGQSLALTVLSNAVGTWSEIMGSRDDPDFLYEVTDVYGGEVGSPVGNMHSGKVDSLAEFASFQLVGRPQEAGVFRGVAMLLQHSVEAGTDSTAKPEKESSVKASYIGGCCVVTIVLPEEPLEAKQAIRMDGMRASLGRHPT
ncbi:hypothetical protein C8R45DRAFT_922574 [Mycena sanguinolenta]|nr:hypothetical protein C8R45DRAFT_922574 [Mycena sanguinolenta]